jgi:hypothetical protein
MWKNCVLFNYYENSVLILLFGLTKVFEFTLESKLYSCYHVGIVYSQIQNY